MRVATITARNHDYEYVPNLEGEAMEYKGRSIIS